MKKAKAPRVPVLENAFEVNLPKIMRMAKATNDRRVILDNGDARTVAVVTETRLAVLLGGRAWTADVVIVHCLKGRVRPLLKCPRAHEGNFQSLYYRFEELACRHCHKLRYQSTLASTARERQHIARYKFLKKIGAGEGIAVPIRKYRTWRKKHLKNVREFERLNSRYSGSVMDSLKP